MCGRSWQRGRGRFEPPCTLQTTAPLQRANLLPGNTAATSASANEVRNCLERGGQAARPYPAGAMSRWLLANFQTSQQIEIQLRIRPLHVVQQTASPTDHSQQPTPAGIVLGVQFQMIGHLADPTGEQRNLNLRRSRI